MKKARIILLFFFIFVFCKDSICLADSVTAKVKEGNRLYSQEKFDEALQKYNEALSDKPDSALIHFNSGTALYKKRDYEEAAQEFTKALVTDNLEIESASNYNIGNCKYRQGKLKINTDLAQAVQLYREALGYYKRAIELDQKNEDAKFNHEFVEKELKILLDKLKQQSQQPEREEKQAEQEEQVQTAKATSPDQQQRQQQEQEQEEVKTETAEGEEQQEALEMQTRDARQEEEISEEEARMILEQYGREDRGSVNMQKRRERSYYPEVLKDW